MELYEDFKMTRLLRTILISTVLSWPIASIATPPIWDTDFGNEVGSLSDGDQFYNAEFVLLFA